MGNLHSTMQQLLDGLPTDTGWDTIWMPIIAASTGDDSIEHRMPAVARLLPALQSADADWDQIWTVALAASQERSNLRVDTAPTDSESSHVAPPRPGETTQDPVVGCQTPGIYDTLSEHKLTVDQLAARGLWYKLATFAVIGLGISVLIFLDTQIDRVTAMHKIAINLTTPFWLYIAFLLHRNGRYFSQCARDLSTHDTRHPVLYLRAFKADEAAAEPEGPSLTEEEQLVGIFRSIGPVIALDDPSGSRHFPGATRTTAPDTMWQPYVQSRMKEARLVVIRLADTPAVFWEFEQARELLEPCQLLLILPSSAEDEYERCRAFAAKLLDVSLPEICFQLPLWRRAIRRLTRTKGFEDYFSFRGCIYFDNSWRGTYLQPRLSLPRYLRSPINQVGKASMMYCLKPVFERLGEAWHEPPLNPATVAVMCLFVGGALWGILTKLVA